MRVSRLIRSRCKLLTTCRVSLLSPFEDCERWDDWEVGPHGIYLTFDANRQHYSSTYLPDVMPAQGWTKSQAIKSAVKKAGYRGSVDDAFLDRIQVQRYTSSKCSASWKEYQASRT